MKRSFHFLVVVGTWRGDRAGHVKGKERLEQTISSVLIDLRIPFLTVYALSLDNLRKRSPQVCMAPAIKQSSFRVVQRASSPRVAIVESSSLGAERMLNLR